MQAAFSEKRLGQLRQLLHEYATLDLQEDELYEAATAIVRFVADACSGTFPKKARCK